MCAKSKSFFGLRRGSTKSLTFQVVDGQQITKDRVTEVRNPRTERQRIQRVLMNTALRAYSHMIAICNHSWEGVQYGGKTQQRFISDNIKAVRLRLSMQGEAYKYEKAFTPLGKTFVAPNAYIVSNGSLPVVPYSIDNGLVLPKATTYLDIISAIKAQPGDQITICLLVGDNNPVNTAFAYCRVILQPQDASGANLGLDTPFIANGKINMPNLRNENTGLFVFTANDDAVIVGYNNLSVLAGAVIMSRYVNDKWLRSSQTMAYATPKVGYNLIDAVTQSKDEIAVNDPYYLNNASDAEVNAVARVTDIKYGGQTLPSGATKVAGQSLLVYGTGLGAANIVLTCDGQEFVQAGKSDTMISYTLNTAGNYQLKVNGELYVSFVLTERQSGPIVSDVRWNGSAVQTGANVSANEGTAVQLQMTLPAGTSADAVTASNSNIVISNASISGQQWTGSITPNGDGTIMFGSVVVLAISAVGSVPPPPPGDDGQIV